MAWCPPCTSLQKVLWNCFQRSLLCQRLYFRLASAKVRTFSFPAKSFPKYFSSFFYTFRLDCLLPAVSQAITMTAKISAFLSILRRSPPCCLTFPWNHPSNGLLKLARKRARACTHAFTRYLTVISLQTLHRNTHITKNQLLTGCIVGPKNYTPTLHRDFSWFWLTAFSAKIRFWLTVFWNSWPFPKKVDLCGQIGFSIDWRAAVKGWCIVGV